MTRIDTAPLEDREALKEELLQEIKSDGRRRDRWRCLGCSIFFLIVILTPIVALGTVLAKTGLVTVPILSKWLYSPEFPRRSVTASTSSGEIDALLRARSTINAQTKLVTTRLSEEDITALLRKQVIPPPGAPIDPNKALPIEQAQVVIDPDALEVFVATRRDNRLVTVIATFQPRVVDKKLALNLRRVDIGNLTLPQFISVGVIDGFLRNGLKDVEAQVAGFGQLEQLQFGKGSMTIVFRPKK